MKAILRTWHNEEDYTDRMIDVSDDYDFGKSPYDAENERCYSRCVGSNQQIVSLDEIKGDVNED